MTPDQVRIIQENMSQGSMLLITREGAADAFLKVYARDTQYVGASLAVLQRALTRLRESVRENLPTDEDRLQLDKAYDEVMRTTPVEESTRFEERPVKKGRLP